MLVKLIRFGVVGGAMTLLNYALFTEGIRLGAGYLVSASFAWIITVLGSYLLNRYFTFRAQARPSLSEFVAFVSGCVLQLGFGLADYALLIGRLDCNPTAAFVINTVLTAISSYSFMRLAVFRLPARCDAQVSPA